MGGGSYSYMSAKSRTVDTYQSQSKEAIFTNRTIAHDMDPKYFQVRESCDSEEHPVSFPIIIALDETGSMGRIPHNIISNLLPDIIKKLTDLGIENPQVCFMGIGDAQYEREKGPIQVGQFESSDSLMEHWLKNIYLEGCGGGNGGEDYSLAWYIAAYKTKTDSFDKRGKKGVLITIGDEPVHKSISNDILNHYIKINDEKITTNGYRVLKTKEFLKDAQKKWDVYHIHMEGANTYSLKCTNWKEMLDDNHIKVSYDQNGNDLADILPTVIFNSYKQTKSSLTPEDALFEGVEVGD